MMDDPVLDPAALVRLRDLGGDSLVVQIVGLYLENAAERHAQILRGLAPEGGLEEAARGAHSLKSSAANVGAMRVSRICADLEVAAGGGEASLARRLAEELEGALAAAENHLREAIGGGEEG